MPFSRTQIILLCLLTFVANGVFDIAVAAMIR
jgi:hypothetical protein